MLPGRLVQPFNTRRVRGNVLNVFFHVFSYYRIKRFYVSYSHIDVFYSFEINNWHDLRSDTTHHIEHERRRAEEVVVRLLTT